MYVRKDCMTFKVLDQKIDLISDETAYGQNTVAEINGHYYYLSDAFPNVAAAISAWQEVHGRELTKEEHNRVMIDNHLISGGI